MPIDPISLGLMAAGSLFSAFAENEQADAQAEAAKKQTLAQSQAMADQAAGIRDQAAATRDEAGLLRQTTFPVLADAEAEIYNATQAEQNAAITRAAATELERRTRVEGQKALGSIEANYAASGLVMTGSAKDVYAESAVNAEMDALTVRYQGMLQARAYDQDAALARWRAGNTKQSVDLINARADAVDRQAARQDQAANRQDLAALRTRATAGPLASNIKSAGTGRAVTSLLRGGADILRRTE